MESQGGSRGAGNLVVGDRGPDGEGDVDSRVP
jgi:hypothetical protein